MFARHICRLSGGISRRGGLLAGPSPRPPSTVSGGGAAGGGGGSTIMNRLAPPWASFHSSTPAKQGLPDRHGTTILCVRKNGKVCIMGDGMVSMGSMIVKHNVNKIRRIPHKGENSEDKATIVGFAGSTADAFTLLERLEGKLDEYPGQLARSCVELAKGWRMDKYLRRLEASLIVADESVSLELTGNGDVLESQDGILGVGSGGPYAVAAARALVAIPDLSAEEVARKSMEIAADMCVYTNTNFRSEVIDSKVENAAKEDNKDV